VCKDEKQWASCLQAYLDDACISGCDRTCGKCVTEICHDMIPAQHEHYYANQLALSSEWPNEQGENALPTKDSSDQLFPFDSATVSTFCKGVFDEHKCDSEDLTLVYDEESFVLNGPAFEYCRFSCGRCSQTGSCYATHNSAMQMLARDPDATVGFFANEATSEWEMDFWGNDEDDETEDWRAPSTDDFFNVDEAEGDDVESDLEETSNFSFGAFSFDSADWSWGRRRRANGFNPRVAGVMNLIRKRRYLNQADDNAQQKASIDSIQTCWTKIETQDNTEMTEEIEEVEGEADIVQYIAERSQRDMAGINEYFAAVTDEVALTMPCDYMPMPYAEASEDMELHYSCELKCPIGQMAMAFNTETDVLEEIEEFNVSCESNEGHSACLSMNYPNYKLLCQTDIDYVAELELVAEEVAAESLEDGGDDYEEDALKAIYDLYALY